MSCHPSQEVCGRASNKIGPAKDKKLPPENIHPGKDLFFIRLIIIQIYDLTKKHQRRDIRVPNASQF